MECKARKANANEAKTSADKDSEYQERLAQLYAFMGEPTSEVHRYFMEYSMAMSESEKSDDEEYQAVRKRGGEKYKRLMEMRKTRASKSESVSKASNAPINPDTLDLPVSNLDHGNKENIKPGGQDGVHEISAKVAKMKMCAFGLMPSSMQLKPGYKPFNHALLGDIEQPAAASSSGSVSQAVRTGTADAAEDLSALKESLSSSVGPVDGPVDCSVDDSPGSTDSIPQLVGTGADDSSAPESFSSSTDPVNASVDDSVASSVASSSTVKLVVKLVKRNNVQSPEGNGDSSTVNSGASSNMSFNIMQARLEDTNPFREARRNPTKFDRDESKALDTALESVYKAGSFEATPKSKFAAALSMRDAMPKPSAEVDPDDYGFLTGSFGQRYTRASQIDPIALYREPNRECVICAEMKNPLEFPLQPVTATCGHPPRACRGCIEMSIRSDLDTKIWTEIRCPECRAALDYNDVRLYADNKTFSRFGELALRATMSQADNFIWCTAGCGSGQIHESSTHHPIVNCLHCSHRSCFQHNVPWHEGFTCKEYDRLLADPENFKSRWENDDQSEIGRRHQVDADGAVARGLVAGEEAAGRRREFKRKQREDRKKLNEAAEKLKVDMIRKKRDEGMSVRTIRRTAKPCPGCGAFIEKKSGCAHITCTKCKYEFCYECGASHREIMRKDNSVHKKTCRFYPANLD